MKSYYLLWVAILYSSCVSYQYARVDSPLKQQLHNDFVFENDTVAVTYSFRGPDCVLNVKVYNKLDVPIRIHWDESAVILNGESLDHIDRTNNIVASAQTSSVKWTSQVSSSLSDLQGVIKSPDVRSFIPPGAFVQATSSAIISQPFRIPREEKTKGNVHIGQGYYVYQQAEFDPEKSPARFRSYLTLAVLDEKDNSARFSVRNDFWVNVIFESGANPRVLKARMPSSFYFVKVD